MTNAWCSSIPKCQCEEVQPRNLKKQVESLQRGTFIKRLKKLKTLIHCNKQYISQYHFLIKECKHYTQASGSPVRLSFLYQKHQQTTRRISKHRNPHSHKIFLGFPDISPHRDCGGIHFKAPHLWESLGLPMLRADKAIFEWIWFFQKILLTEEILRHLGWLKPYK